MSLIKLPKIIFFDMDGTLYLGEKVFDGSAEIISRLKKKEVKCVFLSNNSSKNRKEYLEKLQILNIPADMDDIFTSLNATILKMKSEGVEKIYPLGTPAFEDELKENGFVLTDKNPDVVLLGFDKTINYRKIETAYKHLVKGVRYISTHPDILCPTEEGFIPDAGSFMAMFEKATGRMPEVVGKPNIGMLSYIMQKHGFAGRDACMVGDRLYTDMQMALDAGVVSVLVLSGETKRNDYEKSGMNIDIVVESVKDLIGYWSL